MHAHHLRPARPLGIALALLASPALAAAQGQLWVVDDDSGPGVDFSDIQAAVDAAGDGDAILVKDGTYTRFRIQAKGLSVFAEKDASVEVVEATQFLAPVVSVSDLSATQTVVLRGLSLLHAEEGAPFGESLGRGLDAWSNEGVVWIEDCQVRSFGNFEAVRVSNCETLVVVRSHLENRLDVFSFVLDLASSEGLELANSNVYVYESTVIGGAGGSLGDDQPCVLGIDGSPGAVVLSGTLFASGSEFRGGDGADGTRATFFDEVGPATNGGVALELFFSGSRAELVDTQLIPGAGGASSDSVCSDGVGGVPLELGFGTVELLPGTAPSVELESPVRTGAAFDQTFQGPLGNFVAAAYSLTPGASVVPGFFGDLMVSPPLQVAPIGYFPGTQELVAPGGFNGLGGPDFAIVFAQAGAYTFAGTLLGPLHLGAPSATLAVDGEF